MSRRPPLLISLLFAVALGALLYTSTASMADSGESEFTARPSHVGTSPPPPSGDAAPPGDASLWLPPRTDGNAWVSLSVAGGASAVSASCGPTPGPSGAQRSPVPLERLDACPPSLRGERRDACELARRTRDGAVLLLASEAATDGGLRERLRAARGAAPDQALLLALDGAAASLAQEMGVAWWRLPVAEAGGPRRKRVAAAQWRAASLLLRAGCAVVVSGPTVTWLRNPYAHLSRDVDVEAAQLGLEGRGSVVGVHDAPMGWSAYGQTMTIPLLDPSVVALQPTAASAALAAGMAARLGAPSVRSTAGEEDDEAMVLTRLAHGPAHDDDARAGVSTRVLRRNCFAAAPNPRGASYGVSDAVSVREPSATDAAGGRGGGGAFGPSPNDILASATFGEARARVLSRGCVAAPPSTAAADAPRPLNLVLPSRSPFPLESACRADENSRALCETLRKAAIRREVLAAVSNKNIHQMLATFIAGCRRANITNTMIVALDEPTADFARGKGAHTYLRKLVSRTGSTDNHATSGLKFAVLREFIAVGCSVLLSDVDVLWMQNPFTLPSIYRDVDVEGMTDGWDDFTAFGYRYEANGGSSLRLSARNSGLFYLQATEESLRMMTRLKRRMETEGVWDQTAYNEEMWYAATGSGLAHGVSARVMNYFCHMNSKALFRFMMKDEALMAKHRPVSIHINYHPEKLPRMEDAFERYHGIGPDVDLGAGVGKPTKRSSSGGLHAWHWGVGLKAGKSCREAVRQPPDERSELAQKVIRAGGVATWAGMKGLKFGPSGALTTPWGGGTWGRLRDASETLFADFIGQQHVLKLHEEGWPKLLSTRCADFENVTVVLVEKK